MMATWWIDELFEAKVEAEVWCLEIGCGAD